MVYALSWFVVASLIALWCVVAWALHAITWWTVSNAGSLTGVASVAGAIALPEWLASWVPPAIVQSVGQLLVGLGPLIDSLLQAAPALAGGVTAMAWVVWGIGCLLLVLSGAGAHLLIAMWRRHGAGRGPHPWSPSQAA